MHGESEEGVGKSLIEPESTFYQQNFAPLFSSGGIMMVKPLIGIFAHGKEEAPGFVQELLDQTGKGYRIYPLHETGEVPEVDLTRLVILGGKMSVNDEREFPWLPKEKEIIRRMAGRERPVLGICLGAQMIASAFGAAVFPSERGSGSRVKPARLH